MSTGDQAPGRHASWIELFFDLVCVAAVAQLADALHGEPGWGHVALAAVMYYAVWSVWTSFTLYGNVRGEQARVRFMIYGMATLGVMAAAIPQADGHRANTFAIVYFVSRLVTSRSWGRTGSVITAWPAAQLGLGLLPWIASLWVDSPWKYGLWALGALIDVVLSVSQGFRPERLVRRMTAEHERREGWEERRQQRGGGQRRDVGPKPRAAIIDAEHLGERSGLFLIIVLGEAIIQVVHATGDEEWNRWLGLGAAPAFGLAICLWWLTFTFGVLAVPGTASRDVPHALALPSHFAMTAGIVAMAAGTGTMLAHPDGHAPTAARWLLCAGIALFFGNVLVSGVVLRAPWHWLWFAALPAVLVPLALGVFGGVLPGWGLLLGVFVAALWIVIRSRPRRADAKPDSAAATA